MSNKGISSFVLIVLLVLLAVLVYMFVKGVEFDAKSEAEVEEQVIEAEEPGMGQADEVGTPNTDNRQVQSVSSDPRDAFKSQRLEIPQLESTTNKQSNSQKNTQQPNTQNKTVSSQKDSTSTTSEKQPVAKKGTVSTKVRVENRYVEEGKTVLPSNASGFEGEVVVNVTVSFLGQVTETSINSATTIQDEDLLYECREAALKTKFASNISVGMEGSKGTITYIFNIQ